LLVPSPRDGRNSAKHPAVARTPQGTPHISDKLPRTKCTFPWQNQIPSSLDEQFAALVGTSDLCTSTSFLFRAVAYPFQKHPKQETSPRLLPPEGQSLVHQKNGILTNTS